VPSFLFFLECFLRLAFAAAAAAVVNPCWSVGQVTLLLPQLLLLLCLVGCSAPPAAT
jgi:hypothetical protein